MSKKEFSTKNIDAPITFEMAVQSVGDNWKNETKIISKYDQLFIDIMAFIGNTYNFKIDKFKIMRGKYFSIDNATAAFEIKGGKITYSIEIMEFDKDKYFKNDMHKIKGIDIFFTSLDICEENLIALASYVFIILHEIGHIYRYNKYEKKLKKLCVLDSTIKSANLLFHNIISNPKKYNYLYTELQTESNSDVFAYKHFYLIWKLFNLNDFYNNIERNDVINGI